MGIFRVLSLMLVVPTTMILTVSFFVLFATRFVTEKPLKLFGVLIAILLWISAATVFGVGVYIHSAAPKAMSMMRCPMMNSPMMDKGMDMGKGMMGKGMDMKGGMTGHKMMKMHKK